MLLCTHRVLANAITSVATVAALREVIDALDRHVPSMARAGEVQICKQAADLKSEAVARIQALGTLVATCRSMKLTWCR